MTRLGVLLALTQISLLLTESSKSLFFFFFLPLLLSPPKLCLICPVYILYLPTYNSYGGVPANKPPRHVQGRRPAPERSREYVGSFDGFAALITHLNFIHTCCQGAHLGGRVWEGLSRVCFF